MDNVRICTDADGTVRAATLARNLPHSDVANRGSMVPTAKPAAVEKRPRAESPGRHRKKAKPEQVHFGKHENHPRLFYYRIPLYPKIARFAFRKAG